MFKKIFFISILVIAIISISILAKSKNPNTNSNIVLNYYKLFEPEENIQPLISKYELKNPNIKINYRNFTNTEEYFQTINQQLIENKGADIFSMPNSWLKYNHNKITPEKNSKINKNKFLPILIEENSLNKNLYGLPLYIDTIAIYYNENLINQDTINSVKTWNDLINLNQNYSIGLGDGTKIIRSADVFALQLIQSKTAKLEKNQIKFNNLTEIVQLQKKFAKNSLNNQTDNEIINFITGKTALIFGHSFLYKNLLTNIEIQTRKGDQTINPKDIKTIKTPQFNLDNPIYLSSYFTEVVNKNSLYQKEAWEFLNFLSKEENLNLYLTTSNKLSPLKNSNHDLENYLIYQPFLEQLNSLKNFPTKNPINTEIKIKDILNLINKNPELNIEEINNLFTKLANEINFQN